MTTTTPCRVLWAQLEGIESYGVLDGRQYRGVRDVLRCLVHLQSDRAVVITARQLAQRVGLSTKWTRKCLHVLEAFRLIRWTRGHIEAGRPRPGWIKVYAGQLARVVEDARRQARTARREHRAATAHRIRHTVRNHTLWPRKTTHRPLPDQGELNSSLPLREGKEDAAPPGRRRLPAVDIPPRKETTAMQVCIHDIPIPPPGEVHPCPACRTILRRNPARTAASLIREVPTGSTEVAAAGLAATRAALRRARFESPTLL
ncbi:MAG: hypothetical protein QM708_07255 [Propioniciclava sp.]|uniref:hypothetical protein n=1 Tax=Propioniciclava sp. TaxID=2038686 RepID=UPI0039E4AB8C